MSGPIDKREEVELPDLLDILSAIRNTEYAKTHINRHLVNMTDDQRMSLFRAVIEMSLPQLKAALSANREKDAELALLREEAAENARIIGMSGSREAAKDAEIERLKAENIGTHRMIGMFIDTVKSAEAELASLRASGGEKWVEIKEGCEVPEYGEMIHAICTSGPMEPWQEVFESAFTMGWEEMRACGVTHYKPLSWPYTAPPTLPTEKE